MNRLATCFLALIATIQSSCTADRPESEDSEDKMTATISGLREDGTPYATCHIAMQGLVEKLLACFPRYDQEPEESLPTEFPQPYTYKVTIKQSDREFELMVYHQDARLFPGIWRHPDGTHLYFEDNAPTEFLEVAELCSVTPTGANKAMMPIQPRQEPQDTP